MPVWRAENIFDIVLVRSSLVVLRLIMLITEEADPAEIPTINLLTTTMYGVVEIAYKRLPAKQIKLLVSRKTVS